MRKACEGVFFALAVVAACYLIRFFGLSVSDKIPEQNPVLSAMPTFNDCSSFVPVAEGGRRFRFNSNDNSPEAHLRFRIPDFDPTEYVLKLKLKASPRVLETCTMRSAKGSGAKCRVKGDEGDLAIDMDPVDQFLWGADHCCYVGVGFQKPALKDGDEVELVDFKFELK